MNAQIEIQDVSLFFKTYRNPSPSLKETIISLINKQKHATGSDNFFALKNINLSIKSGERIGLIGLNGAGKSTLLKMIAGIYPPSSGKILIKGLVTPMIELGTGMDIELSGRENIYINGALLGLSKQQMREREQEIIDFAEISEFIDMPIKYYSSGMFGRLVFSIGTMINPEILLLDEIFSAGDAHFVEKGTKRMEKLLDQSQIVIFVSHSLNLIERICDRVVVLSHGVIVNDGKPKEMIDYYLEQLAN